MNNDPALLHLKPKDAILWIVGFALAFTFSRRCNLENQAIT